MSDVREINDPDRLTELAPAWDLLFSRTPRASFFHTLQWLKTYLLHFKQRRCLRVLYLTENGQPSAIIPLLVRTERYRLTPVRVLTYPLDDWGSFYGPISGAPRSALQVALAYLASAERNWDLIDLRWIDPCLDETGDQASAMVRTFQTAGLSCRSHVWKRIAVVDTVGSYNDYLDRRDGKFRTELNRAERRAAQVGDVQFRRFRPAATAKGATDPRWDLYEQCVELARKSWQGSSHSGTTLSHPTVSGFLRDCHQWATQLGMLDLTTLHIQGRLAAFAYNYHHLGYVYGLRVGYDPDYRAQGVGKVLWARSIADSFATGDELYDLGPDSLRAKRHWWTRLMPVRAVTHFAPHSPQAQLIRLTRWWHKRREAYREFADAEAVTPGTTANVGPAQAGQANALDRQRADERRSLPQSS